MNARAGEGVASYFLQVLRQVDVLQFPCYVESPVADGLYGYWQCDGLEGAEEIPLFNRVLNAGEIHDLTLNASSDKASAGLSISVDTTATTLSEVIVIGPGYPGSDGKSQETAWDVATAAAHPGDTAWVWGYIVGGDLTTSSIKFEPPFEKSSNLALAASASERERANCFSVELSKTSIRSTLNLVDHPENLGRKVYLYGVVSTYFSLPGLKSVTTSFL